MQKGGDVNKSVEIYVRFLPALAHACAAAGQGNPLAESACLQIAQNLLAHKADPNAPGKLGTRALHVSDTKQIATLLLDSGPEVDAADDRGQTALMKATARGCPDVVEVLLSRRANALIVDDNRKTAADFAPIISSSEAGTARCKELIRAHLTREPAAVLQFKVSIPQNTQKHTYTTSHSFAKPPPA